MPHVIFVGNVIVTTILAWVTLNHLGVVQYNPIDTVVEEFQRIVHYSELDGSIMAPPETLMTVPEIIRSRGYPLEIHTVVTEDGYILELHRIPGSSQEPKTGQSENRKPVVFLQHGIFASSFVFAIGGNDNSLAYILADNGYDVWLGNSRGNSYSRKHVSLDPSDSQYWNFSWEQLGQYDLPATVEYILGKTGQKKLSYIGFSLGCTVFYVGANLRPELNDKIEVMISLGPTARVKGMENVFSLIAPFSTPLKYLAKWTNTGLVMPSDGLSSRALRFFCNSTEFGSATCQYFNLKVFGFSDTTNKSMVHILSGHYPAGGSPKTIFQFFDNYNSGGQFTRYNYGEEDNIKHYGTPEAPKYQMELVTAPVYIFWSKTDPVSTAEDVEWLANSLGNLKESFEVQAPFFSHGDFFMSTRAGELLFKPLLKLLPSTL